MVWNAIIWSDNTKMISETIIIFLKVFDGFMKFSRFQFQISCREFDWIPNKTEQKYLGLLGWQNGFKCSFIVRGYIFIQPI